MKWGEKMFPGVSTAEVIGIRRRLTSRETEDVLLPQGIILVGIGNSRFDEHVKAGSYTERKPDTCSAVLVAKELDMVDDAAITPLLDDVLRGDTSATTRSTQLGALVNLRHRLQPEKNPDTFQWAVAALEATVQCEALQSSLTTTTLQTVFDSVKESFTDKVAAQYVEDQVKKSLACEKQAVTELASIITAIAAVNGVEAAMKWGTETLTAMYQDNIAFNAAKIEFESKVRSEEAATLEGPEPIAFIESGNEHMVNIARSKAGGYATIIVIKNLAGNVAIFVNKRQGLSVRNLAGMIRSLELMARGVTNIRWDENLLHAGEYPAVMHWYYFAAGEMLMNGSLTHFVRPTRLANEELIRAVKAAFHPAEVTKWKQEYGITTVASTPVSHQPHSQDSRNHWPQRHENRRSHHNQERPHQRHGQNHKRQERSKLIKLQPVNLPPDPKLSDLEAKAFGLG